MEILMSTSTASPTWALRLHAMFDWVLWILVVNALWYVFTLLGAIVLGAAPAAAAASALTRRRLRGEVFPAVPAFWREWRRGFVDANLALGPGFAVVALLGLGVGMAVSGSLGSPFGIVSLVALAIAATVTAIAVPMYAHYDLPRRAYLVTASRWMLRNLPHVFVLVLAAVAVLAVSAVVPGIVPFLSTGAWITASTVMCLGFFAANDRRLEEQASGR